MLGDVDAVGRERLESADPLRLLAEAAVGVGDPFDGVEREVLLAAARLEVSGDGCVPVQCDVAEMFTDPTAEGTAGLPNVLFAAGLELDAVDDVDICTNNTLGDEVQIPGGIVAEGGRLSCVATDLTEVWAFEEAR